MVKEKKRCTRDNMMYIFMLLSNFENYAFLLLRLCILTVMYVPFCCKFCMLFFLLL